MLKSKLTKSSTITKGSIKQQSLGSNDNAIRQQHLHASIGKESLNLDHSKLSNLDYEHSGHTGFASAEDLNTQVLIDELEELIPQEQLQILKKNSTVQLLYHDKLYSLSVRAGRNWTYTYIEKSTGDINTITVDMDSGAFDISSSNPVQHNLDSHINDTSVHLQTGERIAWNNKVSATVDETEEKLIFSSEV